MYVYELQYYFNFIGKKLLVVVDLDNNVKFVQGKQLNIYFFTTFTFSPNNNVSFMSFPHISLVVCLSIDNIDIN